MLLKIIYIFINLFNFLSPSSSFLRKPEDYVNSINVLREDTVHVKFYTQLPKDTPYKGRDDFSGRGKLDYY